MASTRINTISLCSGVGWLDLGLHAGLEYLGFDARCVGYVERDAYAANCLLARMEDASLEPAPIWCGDLAEFDGRGFRGVVDCIAAGFPCQPWSNAGQRKGTDDDRWLWPAIARIIGDVQPAMVYLENVPGLVSGCGLNRVLHDLAALGFDAEWLNLTASEVGASHKRERIFILAYSTRFPGGQWPGRQRVFDGGTKVGHSESERITRGRVHPRRRSEGQGATELNGRSPDMGDTSSPGLSQRQGERRNLQREQPTAERAGLPIFSPGPSDPRWERIAREQPVLSPAVESGFRVLADGRALVVDESRVDQLRCAGNGVVPLQAAIAFVELFRRVAGGD